MPDAYIRHGVLTADTVATFTLPRRRYAHLEVVNRDAAAEIYFLCLHPHRAAVDPTVGGDDCEVLPAALSSLEIATPGVAPLTVKLISSGTPTYSIRAE